MKMTSSLSNLDATLNDTIRTVSQISDENLTLASKLLERAYTHILIEQELRLGASFGVSQVTALTGSE
jgi:hypothetical protein